MMLELNKQPKSTLLCRSFCLLCLYQFPQNPVDNQSTSNKQTNTFRCGIDKSYIIRHSTSLTWRSFVCLSFCDIDNITQQRIHSETTTVSVSSSTQVLYVTTGFTQRNAAQTNRNKWSAFGTTPLKTTLQLNRIDFPNVRRWQLLFTRMQKLFFLSIQIIVYSKNDGWFEYSFFTHHSNYWYQWSQDYPLGSALETNRLFF